jgi:pyroglutamyl-peptidase
MTKVLVTAFEPYDRFGSNSSWSCLLELTRELPARPTIVTRRYPVDFAQVRRQLETDLAAGYDFALHLGQAPGSARIELETFGVNLGVDPADKHGTPHPLAADGPAAYQSSLPLADWADKLRAAGVPAAVSYHAGTYLCNAMLYWSHYLAERLALTTRSTFVHLPLDLAQAAAEPRETPCLPPTQTAAAIRLILAELAEP